jgi:hypothetical protein
MLAFHCPDGYILPFTEYGSTEPSLSLFLKQETASSEVFPVEE